jgi:hypothetical protein
LHKKPVIFIIGWEAFSKTEYSFVWFERQAQTA